MEKFWCSLISQLIFIEVKPQARAEKNRCGNGAVRRQANVVTRIENVFRSRKNLHILSDFVTGKNIERKKWAQPQSV